MPSLSGYASFVDLVLLVMLVEWIAFGLSGRGWGVTLAALLPGAMLVLALRAALTDASAGWLLFLLALSLPAHMLDLRLRGWLGSPGRSAERPHAPSPVP